ncbi:hypothetical protein N0V90_005284 [Kalmusia sp. IMI 367209]|nr:hypothetical protein N0V90_005284 [Kalmusia sp. IMI 367209]
MRHLLQTLGTSLGFALVLSSVAVSSSPTPETIDEDPKRPEAVDYTTAEAGNPFVDGWYADPDTAIYDGLYWVFPTSSYAYEEQTYLDAFSSPDLIHWTKYPNILSIENVTWANKAVWAPAPAFRNGKYYIYFGANDIQEGEPEQGIIGGIGVAVADKPQGPYVDAIGKPLIGEYYNGAQPIDQDVFIDDDGQAYIYYGGHSHANVGKLNEDMISMDESFDDGKIFREITPENYVEGSQMIKRNGKYYLMWSEGGWTGPDYSVSYAVADSPLGPFPRKAKILQQDAAVAKGSGHNGVIHVPGTDIYYIVYHRRPLSETDGNHRVLCYDRMYFNENGDIEPVKMLVKDNFADGDMIGWKTFGTVQGTVQVVDSRLEVKSDTEDGVIVTLDTNFGDQTFDAVILLPESSDSAKVSAGLIFRATDVNLGASSFKGYYAELSTTGSVSLSTFNGDQPRTTVIVDGVEVKAGVDHQFRVSAIGESINVFVDDLGTPVLTLNDKTYSQGTNGVAAYNTVAKFGNVSISETS